MTGTIKKRILSLLLALAVLVSTGVTFWHGSVKAQACVGIPDCGTLRNVRLTLSQIEAAISWAEKLAIDHAGGWYSLYEGKNINSKNECTTFSADAFMNAGLPKQPVQAATHFLNPEREHILYNSDDPPRGSIVLYTGGQLGGGHVAISLGEKKVVAGGNSNVEIMDLNGYINYTYSGQYMWYGDMLPPVYEPLTTPTPEFDKETYLVGETINVKWAASSPDSGIQRYWLNLRDKNNKPMFPEPDCGLPEAECGYNVFTNSATFEVNEPGEYTLYITAVGVNNVEVGGGQFTVIQGLKPTVTIAPSGGSFTDNQKVTITAEPSGMVNIYYTTDGTEPTSSSTKYTGGITLTKSTTIKAYAVNSLMPLYKSDVVTATFTKAAAPHTHNWGGWTISTKPTLTATGTATRVCQSDSSHVDTYTLPNLTNSLWTKGASVAATCAAEGSQTYTSAYGSVTIATPKTEHTWGEWNYFPATPAAGAYKMRKCGACGFEQAEDIEHGDKHNSRKVEGTPATCTKTGTADFWVCDDCGMEFSDAECTTPRKDITLPALEHNWGAWKVTTQATEATAGVETRICGRCQAAETRDLPVLEHTHTLVKHSAVSATCTLAGNSAYWTCSACNRMFSDENGKVEINNVPTTAATGHKSNNGEITQAPSCTVKGIKTYKCSVCGETLKTEDIAANGHSWNEWITETPATETDDGVKARTCQNCGEKQTKSIPAISHTHTLVKHNAVSATCMTNGTDEYWTCSGCEGIFGDENGTKELNEIPTIEATDHKWNSGKITAPATTENEGIKTYTCTVCGDTKTESIPKLTNTDPDTPNIHTHTYSTVWSSDNIVSLN